MILGFNLNRVIRPRCELLKQDGVKIHIEKVLPMTDEAFCFEYGYTVEQLEEKINERPKSDEKDIMWKYVNPV